MSVKIEISPIFGEYTGGVLDTEVKPGTVRECLHALTARFPDLKRMLLNKAGDLMHSYDYFINGESVFPKDMSRPLKDGDKLNVIFIIHGG